MNEATIEVHNVASYLKYYINGEEVTDGKRIYIKRSKEEFETVINVGIHNNSKKMLNLTRLRVSISYPHDPAFYLRTRKIPSPTIIADNAAVWEEVEADMLPDTWEAFDVILLSRIIGEARTIPIKFGVITAISSAEIPVELVFQRVTGSRRSGP